MSAKMTASKRKRKKVKMLGNETPNQVMKRLINAYDKYCAADQVNVIQSFRRAVRDGIRNSELCVKMIVEPSEQDKSEGLALSIRPIIQALRVERYFYVRLLYFWNIPLTFDDMAALADLMERGKYMLKHLELMDCLLNSMSVCRLARSFNCCRMLSSIVLDFNEIGDPGCLAVCDGLRGNGTVLSLSLNYCYLGVQSGDRLGMMLVTTAVREVYVDGNDLGCEGLADLIRGCAAQAELEAGDRLVEAEQEEEQKRLDEQLELEAKRNAEFNNLQEEAKSSTSDAKSPTNTENKEEEKQKKKKRKRKGKGGPAPPPPVGPWIYKLHCADNGIDSRGAGGSEALFNCLQTLAQLIRASECLTEVDLEDNLIGNLGGHEIMEALQRRQEEESVINKKVASCREN